MKRILVIGATGNIGREVVSELAGKDVRVRALVRNPQTADLPPHVEVMRGDLAIPESLDESVEGVDGVFLVWTAPPATVVPALERILSRVPRIVFLSSPYKHEHPLFQGGQPNPIKPLHSEIERVIEASGREWTFLRPGMLASNTRFWWAPQIRAGADVVRWPYATTPTAPIDERDIAAVAVRALFEEGHGGAEYILTGPESLSQSEQIEIIGDVIGRPLRMEDISPEEARSELLHIFPLFILNMLIGAWSAAAGQPALVTSKVAEITGVRARTFRRWVVDHAGEFGTGVPHQVSN